jgi:metal-responsive CopG/Arc/MetJ family transcriptional regulator
MLECTCMRTTVELRDDQHAALAALASRRGLRGYSALVQEALDLYLQEHASERLAEVLQLRGILAEDEAAQVERRIAEAWMTWKTTSG